MEFEILEEKIDYRFKDKELLKQALTHSSFGELSPEGVRVDNERLEFLGDAFLDAIAGEELYRRTGDGEGRLTKLRAQIVSEKPLAHIGRELELKNYLRMGRGEILSGAGDNDSLLADGVEAIIGAIFLDGGFQEARRVTLNLISSRIDEALNGELFTDYKSMLQEKVQARDGNNKIEYVLEAQEGPDHNKTFYMAVKVGDFIVGRGKGKSKKEAESDAAKAALKMEE